MKTTPRGSAGWRQWPSPAQSLALSLFACPLLEGMRSLPLLALKATKKRSHTSPTLPWAIADCTFSKQYSSFGKYQRPSTVNSLLHAEPGMRLPALGLVHYPTLRLRTLSICICYLLGLLLRRHTRKLIIPCFCSASTCSPFCSIRCWSGVMTTMRCCVACWPGVRPQSSGKYKR